MKKLFFPLIAGFVPASLSAQLVINEVLFDPAPGNDVNGDGNASATQDEFVEIVNTGAASLDISGYSITDLSGNSFVFPEGTMIAANGAVLLFGGGSPAETLNGAAVFVGSPSLNNTADTITLLDVSLVEVDQVEWMSSSVAVDESFNRSPEFTGDFTAHSSIAGAMGTESPGQDVAGSPFGVALPGLSLSPATILINESGEPTSATLTLTLAEAPESYPITVTLSSSDLSEATVPESIEIASGLSGIFVVMGVDDLDTDGDQDITITASTDGFQAGRAVVTVADDEIPDPTITITIDPEMISENGGSAVATVTLSEAAAADLELAVVIGDASEASADSMVTILSGETSGSVEITALDDAESDGNQAVTVTISDASGVYEEGSSVLTVTDDEDFVPPAILISEVRINAPSGVPGNGEYFELSSAVTNVSLDRLSLVVLGDGAATLGSGVVEEVVSLDGLTMNGNYFVVAQTGQEVAMNPDLERTLAFENSDNVTFLLVSDFTGSEGDDLDTDDNGELDTRPWGALIDGVSFIIVPNPADGGAPSGAGVEWDYSRSLMIQGIGPDGGFVPSHIYRDATNGGAFSIGTFDASDPNAKDSPSAENPGGPVIPDILGARIISLTVDIMTGESEMVVTGLGNMLFNIETSSNLGQETSPWVVFAPGYTETDNADGTVTFSFTDSAIPQSEKRFYRISEAQ